MESEELRMVKQLMKKISKIRILSENRAEKNKILDVIEDCIDLATEAIDDFQENLEDDYLTDLMDQVLDTLEVMQDDLMVSELDDIDDWDNTLEDIADLLERME